jgi:hypothetical protein
MMKCNRHLSLQKFLKAETGLNDSIAVRESGPFGCLNSMMKFLDFRVIFRNFMVEK